MRLFLCVKPSAVWKCLEPGANECYLLILTFPTSEKYLPIEAVRAYQKKHTLDYDSMFDKKGEIFRAYGVVATPGSDHCYQKG